MRRWLAIAALSTAVIVGPAAAQMHGGGARSGGGFGGHGSMGHAGVASSGFRGGASSSLGSRPGAAFGSGLRQPFFHSGSSFAGFRRPGFPSRRFGNRIFISPGFFGYYGYPAYYGGDYYSYADSYPADNYSYYSAPNDDAQQQDISRLEDEVARLREQRDAEQQQSVRAAVPETQSNSDVSTPTLLVFRDRHTQEVQNYAVVGGTLWIFSEQRATKLPLSWLDIEATTKANDERGVDFQVPK